MCNTGLESSRNYEQLINDATLINVKYSPIKPVIKHFLRKKVSLKISGSVANLNLIKNRMIENSNKTIKVTNSRHYVFIY